MRRTSACLVVSLIGKDHWFVGLKLTKVVLQTNSETRRPDPARSDLSPQRFHCERTAHLRQGAGLERAAPNANETVRGLFPALHSLLSVIRDCPSRI